MDAHARAQNNDSPGADLVLEALDIGYVASTPNGAESEEHYFNGFRAVPAVETIDYLHLRVRVLNRGPATAPGLEVDVDLPPGVELADQLLSDSLAQFGPATGRVPVIDCGERASKVSCRLGAPLAMGGRATLYVALHSLQDSERLNLATLATIRDSSTSDPNVEDNRRTTLFHITDPPGSEADFLPDGAEGTAEPFDPAARGNTQEVMRPFAAQASPLERLTQIRRVEVAVLKRQRNRRRCLWLVNDAPRFRATRAPGGECDKGRWLEARGTTRWRFKLDRRWPPGRYTLYSRAVNRAGARENEFSRREGNLITFTVRR